MNNRLIKFIKNPSNTKIVENIVSLGGLKAATMLLPLLIIPHLIKTIGMELVGLLALITSINAYFQTFIDYGFGYTGTREVSRNHLNRQKNTLSFYLITYCKIILIILSFFTIFIISFINEFIKQNLLLTLISLTHLSILSLSPIWFFQGVEDMKKIAFGEISGKILSFFLIISLVKEPEDIILVPLLYTLGQVFSFTLYIIFLRKYINFLDIPVFNAREIKLKLMESWSMFLNILLPNFYNNYSYLAVGYFSSLSAVAAYDIVRKIMNISEQAMAILSKVYYPALSKNFRLFPTFCKVIFFAAIALFVIQLLFSLLSVKILAHTNITIKPGLLYLQSTAPLIFAAHLAYGINALGVNNYDEVLRNITLITSILGFFLVSLLTYYFSAFGALTAVLATLSLRAAISFKVAKKLNLNV